MTSSDKLKAEDASISQSRQQGMDQSASSHGDAGGPADVFPTQGQAAPQAEEGRLGCAGCGIAYEGAHWLEIVLTNEDWTTISPTGHEGGVLCANCIASRLSALGRIDVPWMLTAGPLALCRTPPLNTGEAARATEINEAVGRMAKTLDADFVQRNTGEAETSAGVEETVRELRKLYYYARQHEDGIWRLEAAHLCNAADYLAALTSTPPNAGEEVDELQFWLRKAGEVLAPHSADAPGTPTRDALVFVNAGLNPQARSTVRAALQQEPKQ